MKMRGQIPIIETFIEELVLSFFPSLLLSFLPFLRFSFFFFVCGCICIKRRALVTAFTENLVSPQRSLSGIGVSLTSALVVSKW